MERLVILVGRLYKSVAPTKYFFKVPLVGRFMPLVGVIRRPVESPLYAHPDTMASQDQNCIKEWLSCHCFFVCFFTPTEIDIPEIICMHSCDWTTQIT